MEDLELRLERIEDAILELATSVEDGNFNGIHERVGEALFDMDLGEEE